MEYILFVSYLVIFAWLVCKVKFFTKSGLNSSQLIILFLLKVLAGIFYGWVGLYYGQLAQMVDTWSFHFYGIEENRILLSNPIEYFTNIFRDDYRTGAVGFFASSNSYWNDLKVNAMIKILSIFNLFSLNNYFTNVIFFSFFSLFGPIAVYRVMNDVFPNKKVQVLLATFLVPSFLYWTSGIHKDGLLFTAIGIIVFQVYFGLKNKRFSLISLISIAFSLLIILVLRNFLIVIFIPALLIWVISNRFPNHTRTVYFTGYAFFILLFFSLKYVHPSLNFPEAVVNKQMEFSKLTGGSIIPMKKLHPTAVSFFLNAPQALNLSLIRPYPSDVKHLLSLAAATEINFLLLLFLMFLFWRVKTKPSSQFLYFCLFFSFSLLLTIGYTVNFLGAIVRYRSLIIPFLIVPMVAQINWERINILLFNNINKNTYT